MKLVYFLMTKEINPEKMVIWMCLGNLMESSIPNAIFHYFCNRAVKKITENIGQSTQNTIACTECATHKWRVKKNILCSDCQSIWVSQTAYVREIRSSLVLHCDWWRRLCESKCVSQRLSDLASVNQGIRREWMQGLPPFCIEDLFPDLC